MKTNKFDCPDDFKPQKDHLQIIELETTINWVFEGIIYFHTKPGNQHTFDHALIHQKCISELSGGKRLPIIGDSRKALPLDKKTRDYYSSEEGTKNAASFAFLVDSNFSKVLANIFIKLVKLKVPTRMFTDLNEAIKWSSKYIVINS